MEFWDIYRNQIIQNVENLNPQKANGLDEEATPEAETNPYFLTTWILVAIVVILIIILVAILVVTHRTKSSSYDLSNGPTVKYVVS